jgi:hypothetical protein
MKKKVILEFMNKKIQVTTYKPSLIQRNTLIACTVIMLGFTIFVLIATGGSLGIVTVPFAILGLTTLASLFINKKGMVYASVVLGVLGALVAAGLAIAYLPYYASYQDYINSIQ